MTYDLEVWRPRMEAVAGCKIGDDKPCEYPIRWSCGDCPIGEEVEFYGCPGCAAAFLAANPAPQEHKEG